MMDRRSFIRGAGAAAAAVLLPRLVRAQKGLVRFQLTARQTAHDFSSTGKNPASLWLYNETVPGPLLTAVKGDMLEVDFVNQLEEPTTIHWHGIRNLNEMDGVPELTQPAIQPGETFRYRFPLRDAGSFWYHAHNMAWQQVARGLYGPLIVRDDAADSPADIVIMADDWRLRDDFQLDEASFGSLHDWSHGGRLGNWLTVNGASQPDIEIPASGGVRLRLMNAANARVMRFQFSDKRAVTVLSVDGAPCDAFEVTSVSLGPAQRVDLFLDSQAGLPEALYEISGGAPMLAARFVADDRITGMSKAPAVGSGWYLPPAAEQEKIIDIHMQGGAMGSLSSARFQGEERTLRDLAMQEGKLWAFNGTVGGYDQILAELTLGESAMLRIWNDTAWQHAMHLHGQHFWVRSAEFGAPERLLLRDTYLMAPGEKAELLFIADNPGLWLFHCHMLEHHAAGMGGVLAVS